MRLSQTVIHEHAAGSVSMAVDAMLDGEVLAA
jgi:hypothetical protein